LAGEVRVQHLDRHLAVERGVQALVHDAHPAGAQLLQDAVPADLAPDQGGHPPPPPALTGSLPKLIPRLLAKRTMSPAGSTLRSFFDSESGTATISAPRSATMSPHCPSRTRSSTLQP